MFKTIIIPYTKDHQKFISIAKTVRMDLYSTNNIKISKEWFLMSIVYHNLKSIKQWVDEGYSLKFFNLFEVINKNGIINIKPNKNIVSDINNGNVIDIENLNNKYYPINGCPLKLIVPSEHYKEISIISNNTYEELLIDMGTDADTYTESDQYVLSEMIPTITATFIAKTMNYMIKHRFQQSTMYNFADILEFRLHYNNKYKFEMKFL